MMTTSTLTILPTMQCAERLPRKATGYSLRNQVLLWISSLVVAVVYLVTFCCKQAPHFSNTKYRHRVVRNPIT